MRWRIFGAMNVERFANCPMILDGPTLLVMVERIHGGQKHMSKMPDDEKPAIPDGARLTDEQLDEIVLAWQTDATVDDLNVRIADAQLEHAWAYFLAEKPIDEAIGLMIQKAMSAGYKQGLAKLAPEIEALVAAVEQVLKWQPVSGDGVLQAALDALRRAREG